MGYAKTQHHEDVLERVLSLDPELAVRRKALRLASLMAFSAFIAPSLDVDAIEGGDLRARIEDDGIWVDVREGTEWVADIGPLPAHDLAILGEGLVQSMCQ